MPINQDDPQTPPTIYLIKQLEIAVRHRLDRTLGPAGITAVQYSVLTELQAHPSVTGADLARRWHISPQSISETIVTMENDGLVVRTPNPAHRKRLNISLTPKGTELLERTHEDVAALDRAINSEPSMSSPLEFRKFLIAARRALEQIGSEQDL